MIGGNGAAQGFLRQGQSCGQRIVGQHIDQTQIQCLFCCHAAAMTDQIHRCGHADQPRQALRCPCTGHQTQRHLGLPQRGSGGRNPHPAGQRDFQTATQGRTGNRSNRRAGQIDQFGQHIVQLRGQRRAVELFGIRARDKGATCACQDQPLGPLGAGAGDGRLQSRPHRLPEDIQRRVVEGDDRRLTVTFIADGHGFSSGLLRLVWGAARLCRNCQF